MRTFAKQKSHIMADQQIDIERMIMQAHYKMQLEAEASSVKGGQLSDMEREQYQNQIKDLLQAVETLLKSNKAMGEKVTQLEKVAEAYDDLKAKYEKLEGELAMRKRGESWLWAHRPRGIRLNTIKNRKPLIFNETPRTPAHAGAKGYGKKGVGCIRFRSTFGRLFPIGS